LKIIVFSLEKYEQKSTQMKENKKTVHTAKKKYKNLAKFGF